MRAGGIQVHHALEAYSLRGAHNERLLAFRSLVGLSGEGAASRTTWIQIAPLGEWHGHGDGPFELTEESFASCIRAFKAQANPPQVDYEHASLYPNGGPIPAAGWVQDLAVRDGWLCAQVEFTDRAAGHIKAGEYRFNSGVFAFDRPDRKSGKSWACVLDSVALTNRPFIDGQNPIALTQKPAARALSHGDPKMEISREALMAGLESIEGDMFTEQQLNDLIVAIAALESAKNPQAEEAEVEVEVEEMAAQPALADVPVAEMAGEPVADPAADAGMMIAEKLMGATGMDAAALLAAVEANLDALVAALSGSGQPSLPMSDSPVVAAMSDTIKSLGAKLSTYQSAEREAAKRAVDRQVDELVAAGKVLPGALAQWKALAHTNHAQFVALSAVLPVIVPVGPEASATPTPPAKSFDDNDPFVVALTNRLNDAGVKDAAIRERHIAAALTKHRRTAG